MDYMELADRLAPELERAATLGISLTDADEGVKAAIRELNRMPAHWQQWRGPLPRESPALGRDPLDALGLLLRGESEQAWLSGYVDDHAGTVVGFVFSTTDLFWMGEWYIHLWPYTY